MHRQKLILTLLLLASSLHAQIIQGVKVQGVAVSTAPAAAPPASGLAFAPVAGFYVGTQNVSTSYVPSGSGQSIFYTTDGSAASAASTLFSGPIAVSTATTISALVEQTGSVRQEMQKLPVTNTSAGWKICTPNGGGPGTPTSVACGGVGSTQPSAWSVVPNTTFGGVSGVETISLTGTSGAPQILVTTAGSGCDSCTKLTMDKWIKPLDGDTGVMNHELDGWQNDGTRNREHMGGLQCNQQSAFLQWQYDNSGGGGWQNTGITDKCPLSTTLWTHVIFGIHWILGDTGCGDGHTPSVLGGMGCTYYDYIAVCTATSPSVGCTPTVHVINKTLQANSHTPSWGPNCADQDQVDLRSGSHTGGIVVAHNNVTCSFSTITSGSANYTF